MGRRWLQSLQRAQPDALVILRNYRRFHGRWPRLFPPRTYSEKLCWLMLFRHDPVVTQCADKYAVRDYVTSRGLSHILNELYGVWSSADAIDFDFLPTSFVLRVAWGWDQNVICPNKAALDIPAARAKLRAWLACSHYWRTREWSYRHIPPRVVAERYLGPALRDYKFMCFNGEPLMVQVHFDRFEDYRQDFYDLEWRRLPVRHGHPNADTPAPRPAMLTEMAEHARTLAAGHPFVRVDLYAPDDERVVFGEMTWYPHAAKIRFDPPSFDAELGAHMSLPGWWKRVLWPREVEGRR